QAPPGPPDATRDLDEFDEIEGRAAQLMARMEAQRLHRQAQQSPPAEDIPAEAVEEPRADSEIADDVVPEAEEPTTGPVDVPTGSNGLESPTREQPGTTADTAVPEQPERPSQPKQMVLPPWQSFTPSIEPEPQATPGQQAAATTPPPQAGHAQQPEDPAAPPPPTWRGGPPVPEPDWHRPPPGWSPAFPPPPPGLQGPPPRALPPDPVAH